MAYNDYSCNGMKLFILIINAKLLINVQFNIDCVTRVDGKSNSSHVP